MVQQNNLRIKLNSCVGLLLNECATSKRIKQYRLLYSTDLLFMLGGALGDNKHVYVLLKKIDECTIVKMFFEHKLIMDAQ